MGKGDASCRRGITPTPRQQGIEAVASPVSSRWAWARLLKRVFTLDMERCPRCQSGILRLIAAITERSIICRILRHLNLVADPPSLAAARLEQGRFAWTSASSTHGDGVVGLQLGTKCVRSIGRQSPPHESSDFEGQMGPYPSPPEVDQEAELA